MSNSMASISTSNPASCSISKARSRPHIMPSPAPPSTSPAGMQCISETAYRKGPMGWSIFSSTLDLALMSTMQNTPPSGRNTFLIARSASDGRCRSWITSKEVTRSKHSQKRGSLPTAHRSMTCHSTLASPSDSARARAAAMEASDTSSPTNEELGYALAISMIAAPSPHPTSSTRAPPSASRAATAPPRMEGRNLDVSSRSCFSRAALPIQRWNGAYLDAGMPLPLENEAQMSWKQQEDRRGISSKYSANPDRLFALSSSKEYNSSVSVSVVEPVTISAVTSTARSSRAKRGANPAGAQSSSTVFGDALSCWSNPQRYPTPSATPMA
mmetsp:Transcript_4519/g.14588  ORF Transcript_4519/g.14588 Transcript_4519/m.14588 type:complete len:328 (+) Transcript_4519:815-1798(+)